MIIRNQNELDGMGRVVECPNGGFTSNRYLLENDNMGFSLTKTIIHVGKPQTWHYKKHLEACLCISGIGYVTNNETGEKHEIKEGTMYALDKNDNHTFEAVTRVILICVFNPPLAGKEVHKKDGSY